MYVNVRGRDKYRASPCFSQCSVARATAPEHDGGCDMYDVESDEKADKTQGSGGRDTGVELLKKRDISLFR